MYNVPFTGNLTREPKMFDEGSDNPRALFTLAIERPNRNGEEREAEFYDFTAYGSTALNMKSIPVGTRLNVQANIGQYKKDVGGEYPLTMITLNANEVSPSLRWATAEVTKTAGKGFSNGGGSKSKASASREEAPAKAKAAPAKAAAKAAPAADDDDIF